MLAEVTPAAAPARVHMGGGGGGGTQPCLHTGLDRAIAIGLRHTMGLRVARLLPAPAVAARRLAGAGRPPLPSSRPLAHSWRGALACTCGSAAADAADTAAAAAAASAAAALPPTAASAAQAQAQPAINVLNGISLAALSTADLQRFISERGIAAEVVPPLQGAAPPPGCCELKSLVFLAGGQPVVSTQDRLGLCDAFGSVWECVRALHPLLPGG